MAVDCPFPAFPKILHMGQGPAAHILEDPVEVTEKIDGSQIAFGKIGGELFIRSKGARIYPEATAVQSMFRAAVDRIDAVAHLVPDGVVLYGEYLRKPKHNTLAYDRVPAGHIALFGVMEAGVPCRSCVISALALTLGFDAVPLLAEGRLTVDEIKAMLGQTSYLGGEQIEGVVVKNYHQTPIFGHQVLPLLAAKYVDEKFKERHSKPGNKERFSGNDRFTAYAESYRTEARWRKAVQHLRDAGLLRGEPRDIGPLIREVKHDILEEHVDEIKEWLFKEYSPQIMRVASKGAAEWYKEQLLDEARAE